MLESLRAAAIMIAIFAFVVAIVTAVSLLLSSVWPV